MNNNDKPKLKIFLYKKGSPIPDTIEADCIIVTTSTSSTPLAIISSWSHNADAYVCYRIGDEEFPHLVKALAPALPIPQCKEINLDH